MRSFVIIIYAILAIVIVQVFGDIKKIETNPGTILQSMAGRANAIPATLAQMIGGQAQTVQSIALHIIHLIDEDLAGKQHWSVKETILYSYVQQLHLELAVAIPQYKVLQEHLKSSPIDYSVDTAIKLPFMLERDVMRLHVGLARFLSYFEKAYKLAHNEKHLDNQISNMDDFASFDLELVHHEASAVHKYVGEALELLVLLIDQLKVHILKSGLTPYVEGTVNDTEALKVLGQDVLRQIRILNEREANEHIITSLRKVAEIAKEMINVIGQMSDATEDASLRPLDLKLPSEQEAAAVSDASAAK